MGATTPSAIFTRVRTAVLMSAVKGLAARERPLQRAASKDDRAQVGAEPEGRR